MNAKRDDNGIPALLGTLNTDGVTTVPVLVANNRLMVSDGTTGSGTTTLNAQRDENRVPAFWGVSSDDGVTPVAIWVDARGRLLIDSN